MIQSTSPTHVGDNNMELLALIDEAMRAHASEITAVLPYAGMMRHDRKVKARVPISAALAFNTICDAGGRRSEKFDIFGEKWI